MIFAANYSLNQKILHELYSGNDGNVLISPYSLSIAMQMVTVGSVGQTEKELNLLFGESTSFEVKGIESANSFWFRKGLRVKAAYIDKVNKLFRAKIFYLEEKNIQLQAKKINDWVATNTKNKITDLVTPANVEGVEIILLNSVYFKDNWRTPFDKGSTHKGIFYNDNSESVEVFFMFKEGRYRYFENEQFQFVAIPYQGQTTLYVAIPKVNFKNGLKLLTEKYFKNMVAQTTLSAARLYLPKIDLAIKIDAKETFKKLGIKQAFAGTADFSKMVDDTGIFISNIWHKVAISWDEIGTQAAAATAVALTKSALFLDEPIDININHPFIFWITTENATEVLFSGFIQKL
jgi:serpin B